MTRMSTIYSRLSYGTGTTLTGCGVSAKAYAETAKTAKEVSWMLVDRIAEVVAEIPGGDHPQRTKLQLQLQRAEIADCTQFCGQVDFHEIPCNVRLSQKLPECGVVWS